MLKKTISFILLGCFIMGFFPVNVLADAVSDSSIIQSRAHIIEWRYKQINGVWHKRKYDCTAQKWIGSWTPV